MREMSASRKTLLIAILVVVLDQYTKHLIVSNVPMMDAISCCDIFSIVHVENKGVAFGVLNSAHRFVLFVLAAAILFGFLIWLRKNPKLWAPGGLIVGGAIGNLIDRGIRGIVVDFLDFHVKNYHWPAFNVADSAVVLGVACLLFWREEKK